MPTFSFAFSFKITLAASADRAYRWATDFGPGDIALMGQEGRRTVERITRDTLILDDTVRTGRRTVRKVRLVRLLPKEWKWTNTHIGGPLVHSQFLYEIEPRGRNRCRLTFTGMQVEHPSRAVAPADVARRARQVATEDRATWVRFARALKKDLRRRR